MGKKCLSLQKISCNWYIGIKQVKNNYDKINELAERIVSGRAQIGREDMPDWPETLTTAQPDSQGYGSWKRILLNRLSMTKCFPEAAKALGGRKCSKPIGFKLMRNALFHGWQRHIVAVGSLQIVLIANHRLIQLSFELNIH